MTPEITWELRQLQGGFSKPFCGCRGWSTLRVASTMHLRTHAESVRLRMVPVGGGPAPNEGVLVLLSCADGFACSEVGPFR